MTCHNSMEIIAAFNVDTQRPQKISLNDQWFTDIPMMGERNRLLSTSYSDPGILENILRKEVCLISFSVCNIFAFHVLVAPTLNLPWPPCKKSTVRRQKVLIGMFVPLFRARHFYTLMGVINFPLAVSHSHTSESPPCNNNYTTETVLTTLVQKVKHSSQSEVKYDNKNFDPQLIPRINFDISATKVSVVRFRRLTLTFNYPSNLCV